MVDAVEAGSSFVVIDSLNAYLQSMSGANHLLLHMHELLSFLNHKGVTTMLVVGQHGVIGDVRADIDLSYVSDATLLFRFFEAGGEVRSAVTAIKSRTSQNEHTIREFRLSEGSGLQVGEPLKNFEGVLSGLPSYAGSTRMLDESDR